MLEENVFKLLYGGYAGDILPLDEVQLLDDPPAARVAALGELLGHPDGFVRYQATLILTAWGVECGMQHAEQLIRSPHQDAGNFAADRLTGADRRYDLLAEAIHLYLLSGGSQTRAAAAFNALLALYPHHYFQSQLKRALLHHATRDMADRIAESMQACLAAGKTYQGSQLLPVLAKLAPQRCWKMLSLFAALPGDIPDPATNVAEALRYIPSPESDAMLAQYLLHDGGGVAAEARASLAFRTGSANRSDIHPVVAGQA